MTCPLLCSWCNSLFALRDLCNDTDKIQIIITQMMIAIIYTVIEGSPLCTPQTVVPSPQSKCLIVFLLKHRIGIPVGFPPLHCKSLISTYCRVSLSYLSICAHVQFVVGILNCDVLIVFQYEVSCYVS